MHKKDKQELKRDIKSKERWIIAWNRLKRGFKTEAKEKEETKLHHVGACSLSSLKDNGNTCKKGSESMGKFSSEMWDRSSQNYFWFHPGLRTQCVDCR